MCSLQSSLPDFLNADIHSPVLLRYCRIPFNDTISYCCNFGKMPIIAKLPQETGRNTRAVKFAIKFAVIPMRAFCLLRCTFRINGLVPFYPAVYRLFVTDPVCVLRPLPRFVKLFRCQRFSCSVFRGKPITTIPAAGCLDNRQAVFVILFNMFPYITSLFLNFQDKSCF